MKRILTTATLLFVFTLFCTSPLKAKDSSNVFDIFIPYAIFVSPDGQNVAIKSWRYTNKESEVRLEIKDGSGKMLYSQDLASDSAFSSIKWTNSDRLVWIAAEKSNPEVVQFDLSKGLSSIYQLEKSFESAKWSEDSNYLLTLQTNEVETEKTPFKLPNQVRNTESEIRILDLRSSRDVFTYKTSESISDFSLSPDNQNLAVIEYPRGRDWSSYQSQIISLNIQNKKKTAIVTKQGDHSSLFWTDAQTIVFSSQLDKAISNTPTDLYTVNVKSKKIANLTGSIDNFVKFSDFKNNTILTLVDDRLERKVYQISLSGKAKELDVPLPTVNHVQMSADGKCLYYIAEKYGQLSEAFKSCKNQAPLPLSNTQKSVQNEQFGMQEVVSWKSSDGTTIEGLITLPPNYDKNKQYPLIVAIHGGPRAMDRQSLEDFAYPTLALNQKGAIIFNPQYRGSTGYGDEFIKAHYRQAGLLDRQDVVTGIKFTTKKYNIDDSKIAIIGWSYGGFLAASLLAHNDLEYSAVVVGAGIVDWQLHYSHEHGKATTREFSFGATPWEQPELYRKSSPITYIKNAKAPTLIIHGEEDSICTVASARTLNQALLDNGVESKLVIYPNMGHGPGTYQEWTSINTIIRDWISEKLAITKADKN
ncbi:S9 family peptidase [Aliikangiella sp. G2MR2-5]|uniref:alpha/beta hydrolase family protein n=1 Tax=Aliikangiella sp. G2MR2-5 TaxID=2788943 RepID=UPI0018A911A7|nr:prolyl oligopeptidase family serine peptidase [Aliikangiella sp. G2MR2-5]